MSKKGFIKINNYNEYKELLEYLSDCFDCNEDWEYFFGFKLKWDENTGNVLETLKEYKGEIEYCPERFPCIVYYTFDSKRLNRIDRADTEIQIFDWCYEDEL